ncbi:MAG: HEPN domain-containing protein [Euryarchaeota archaeon]|nr:HEPN domain-containing protein [Euryarchaeota archaeon]
MNKELVKEWTLKAEEDCLAIEELYKISVRRFAAIICFHAQQCAEKYLKALLISHNIEPPRTHSLETLLDLIVYNVPELEQYRDMLTGLTPYSVEYRYPGVAAISDDAEYCAQTVRELRKAFKGIIKS